MVLASIPPNLDPVREVYSKTKALLRKAATRTREELVEGMSEVLSAFTLQEVKGWFAHCGYGVEDQLS